MNALNGAFVFSMREKHMVDNNGGLTFAQRVASQFEQALSTQLWHDMVIEAAKR